MEAAWSALGPDSKHVNANVNVNGASRYCSVWLLMARPLGINYCRSRLLTAHSSPINSVGYIDTGSRSSGSGQCIIRIT